MKILRQAVKRVLFGAVDFSRFRPVALAEPQSEVGVWLHGLGAPQDVTTSTLIASASPLTIGIGMKELPDHAALGQSRLSLRFRERALGNRLLGEIDLSFTEMTPAGDRQLCFFETRGCGNYCLPQPWLWSRYVYYAWKRRGARRTEHLPESRTTLAEERRLFVFYICPRPVMLASVSDRGAFNMVPVDLMGPVGGAHLALSLQTTSTVIPLIERSGRIALSAIPAEHTALTYQMGRGHKEACIDAARLPFPLAVSRAFGLPVPRFALRVREFEIEPARTIGGYTLFLARIVEDERRAEGRQFFLVHGFYSRLAARSAG